MARSSPSLRAHSPPLPLLLLPLFVLVLVPGPGPGPFRGVVVEVEVGAEAEAEGGRTPILLPALALARDRSLGMVRMLSVGQVRLRLERLWLAVVRRSFFNTSYKED